MSSREADFRRYYAAAGGSRNGAQHRRSAAQLIEHVGQQSRSDRPDVGDLVGFEEHHPLRQQEQVVVAQPGQVVQPVGRKHDRGTTIALGLGWAACFLLIRRGVPPLAARLDRVRP